MAEKGADKATIIISMVTLHACMESSYLPDSPKRARSASAGLDLSKNRGEASLKARLGSSRGSEMVY